MSMSSNDPDQIREEIELTRSRLSRDVNELAEGARPSAIVRRRVDRLGDALAGARDSVMGSVDVSDAAGSVKDTVSGAAESAHDVAVAAPGAMRRQTRGNPLAAGLIAFGVGMLAGSLAPATRREEQLAERVKEQAQPLAEQAGAAVKEIAGNLQEPAKEAVDSVRESAKDAADTVRDEATSQTGSITAGPR